MAEAISLEEFLTLLKEFLTTRETEYVRGIELKKDDVNGDKLIFTCFKNLTNAGNTGMRRAAATLFSLMAKTIMSVGEDKKKRLNLHKVQIKQPENEKFVFRTWLTRLGWKGSEGKMERNLLYKNLNGNTAFCTEESKIRWEAKHKTGKRIEATMAVSTAEVEESGAETTVAEPGIEPETDIEATVEVVEAVAVGQ